MLDKVQALKDKYEASTANKQALEDELGVALVERTTRTVRLTEAGVWYRGEVVSVLRALDSADALVAARSREATGRLRITALPGYGEAMLIDGAGASCRAAGSAW